MPHGLTVDFEGNYWMTDVGLHQIFKYDSNFNLLMTFGVAFENGNDENHFCKPTSIGIAKSNGDVFIADGYCNERIAHFDKNGKFIKNFQDKKSPLKVVHSIALIEKMSLVCTVSRQEGR